MTGPLHAEARALQAAGRFDALSRLEESLRREGTPDATRAVERGLLPMDGTLAKRAHELQARRDAVLSEIDSLEREWQLPAELLAPGRIKAFCAALRAKMLDSRSEFGKRYLRLLVEEIRVEGRSVVMRGNHAALAQTVGTKNLSTLDGVPRFGLGWLATKDSNGGPLAGCRTTQTGRSGT